MKPLKFILLIAITYTIGCAKETVSTNSSSPYCEGQPIIGEWSAAYAQTGEAITFKSDCTVHDVKCDLDFEYYAQGSTLHTYASIEYVQDGCFRGNSACEYQIIGSILQISCTGFTKTYKRA